MNWKPLQTRVTLEQCIENRRRNNFTITRLAASLLVVLTHAYGIIENDRDPVDQITGGAFNGSHVGLSVFFFLSGLLVTQSFYTSRSAKNFLWRRFLRLYPGAVFAILFCALILGPLMTTLRIADYFSNPVFFQYIIGCSLVKIYYYLPGVFEQSIMSSSVNASLWSISLELKLYIGLFLFGSLKIPMKKYGLMLLIIACVVCKYFFYNETEQLLVHIKGNHIAFYAYTTYGVYFLIGMLCYAYRSKIVINIYWLPALVILFTGITCCPALSFTGFIFIPALVLYLSANGVNWVRKITPRADLSYGIYLFAYPVQQFAANYLHPGKSIYLFLLTVFISVPFALVSWYFIESKALQVKNLIK